MAFSLGALSLSQAAVFNPQTAVLDNGMEVVVIPNHRAPIVQHMVWYRVGSADEGPDEKGVAHFLEHLMFKGTKKLAPGEFSNIVALNGGEENAFTSQDFTAYYQTVAKDRLEIMMANEADRMVNLRLSDDVVLPEREVVREERRGRIDNRPSSQLSEVMQASFYLAHPYRYPIIGWDADIQGLTTEKALRFYRKWYAPNNAILVVAGDVTLEDVLPLARKYYGPVEPRALPERKRAVEPEQLAARRVTLESERVSVPNLSIRYHAPGYRVAEGNDAYALQVLDQVIGTGPNSLLYQRLVLDGDRVAQVGSGYAADSYDGTHFSFYVAPKTGVDIEEAERLLRNEVGRILEEGVPAEAVEQAKKQLQSASVFARDSLTLAPGIFGRALTTGSSVEAVENWPETIRAVTVDDVNRVLRRFVRDEASVTGVLLPKTARNEGS